jgi:hypothetical protein
MTKTLTQLENEIIKKRYGKNAHPTLIKDKSIEGLIAANKKKSLFSTFNILKEAIV